MRQCLFLLLCVTMGVMRLSAQTDGTVFDAKTLRSECLKGERKFAIYLPPGYNSSERSYPVLYLLHPAGPRGTVPNQQGWIHYGQLKQFMDAAIQRGEIAPMIVVTPDANGEKRISYFNDPEDSFLFEDFFIKELIPYIEKNYRCRTERASRAIAGASAGGGGAFVFALHHPELFATACPLSAAVRPYDKSYMQNRYGEFSEAVLTKWYANYNIYELFKQLPEAKKNEVAWFIACGDDDALSVNNMKLHIELKELGIAHEFRMSDGKHDWTYWRSVLPEMLRYVSGQFQK